MYGKEMIENYNNMLITLLLEHKLKLIIFIIITYIGYLSIPYLQGKQEGFNQMSKLHNKRI